MSVITKMAVRLVCLILFLLVGRVATAQETHTPSAQQKNFINALSLINANFTYPEGFKEAKVVNPFEYALEIPGDDFEIWFRVNTQKDNEKFLAEKNLTTAIDSAYMHLAKEQLSTFTSNEALVRNIPEYMLERYNANAGRTYLIELNDSPLTKHYKYALLIVLQKEKTGTLMAVCFTNVKGPEFFKNINKASNCLKFKGVSKD